MAARGKFDADLKALGAVLVGLEGLEEDRQKWVLDTAASRLGLSGVVPAGSSQAPAEDGGSSTGGGGAAGQTPKQFMKEKKPASDVQRIACLAYFLTHERQQPHFKTKDLTVLNTEAAGPTMGNASQAVDNATKRSHYLAVAGKGNKQITALGEELVEALPDQEAAKKVATEQRPKRRTATRKKRGAKKN